MSQIIYSPDIRRIVWIDALSQGGPEWVTADDAYEYSHAELPTVSQIGYVLFENDNYISITDTICEYMTGTVHSIPKGMIVQMSNVHIGESMNDYANDR